jgi:hypothetical protein
MKTELKMIEEISENLIKLKQEFRHTYSGTSHIQEIIPLSKSDNFPIDQNELDALHLFVRNNPIYYNSYEEKINQTECMVYEGDINKFWLNSISHGSSYQPFSPTWMLTAYIITSIAKTLNYREVLDIGSGDGRIAYCAKILGLDAHAIEIDDMLVELQESICETTKVDFKPVGADAVKFDYLSLNLEKPAFFIGGLAQMGGEMLATSILTHLDSELKQKTCMVLTGSYSEKYSLNDRKDGGWSSLIEKNNLKVIQTAVLPTVWSFNETIDTPYTFAEFG